jgi:hypothetical protein
MKTEVLLSAAMSLYVIIHTLVRKKYSGKYDFMDRVLLYTSIILLIVGLLIYFGE